jgi:hypothetical protein
MSSRRYHKRIKSIKHKARSGIVRQDSDFTFIFLNPILIYFSQKELKSQDDWEKHNYFKNFNMSYDSLPDNIDRIDANKVSLEEFIEKYEKPYKPVIIKNTQVDWLAKDKWTLDVRLLYC